MKDDLSAKNSPLSLLKLPKDARRYLIKNHLDSMGDRIRLSRVCRELERDVNFVESLEMVIKKICDVFPSGINLSSLISALKSSNAKRIILATSNYLVSELQRQRR